MAIVSKPEHTTSSPYSINWDTSGAANGNHFLTATARDGAGNVTTSAQVAVVVSNAAPPASPTPSPAVTSQGVLVGNGFVDASDRQVVRTANNVVYVIVADDDSCQGGGSGSIHVSKGVGAQPGNPNVPTSFVEQDAAHRPVSASTTGLHVQGRFDGREPGQQGWTAPESSSPHGVRRADRPGMSTTRRSRLSPTRGASGLSSARAPVWATAVAGLAPGRSR